MASDFSKLVYQEVQRHVEAQLGDKKLTTREMRALMDDVMPQVARSLVSIIASVQNNQNAAKAQASVKAAEARAASELAAKEGVPDTSGDAPAPETAAGDQLASAALGPATTEEAVATAPAV
jgi:membrane protease subunit (stomatin/prohibitin family)